MPAKSKGASNGGWGVTWMDVSQALEDLEAVHNCTLDLRLVCCPPTRKSAARLWTVGANAVWGAGRANEMCGHAECKVGWGSGAASMPGAALRAAMDACAALEVRRARKLQAQEVASLPGF